jgi:hypothetical protein
MKLALYSTSLPLQLNSHTRRRRARVKGTTRPWEWENGSHAKGDQVHQFRQSLPRHPLRSRITLRRLLPGTFPQCEQPYDPLKAPLGLPARAG